MKKRGRTRDMIEYLAAKAGYACLASCPPLVAARWSRAVAGPILYSVLFRARRHGRASLDLAYGDSLTDAEKNRILRNMFGHLALNAAEFFLYPGPAGVQKPFLLDDESTRIRDVLVRDRQPVIFVSGHLGNWEWYGLTGGGVSFGLNTVSRPLDNTRLNDWITARREIGSQKMWPAKGSQAALSAALRNGEAVVLLVDQNQRRHGVFVDFFGLPAATTRTPALLALRTGTPVVATCLVRETEPFRFRAIFAPPLHPRRDQPVEAEVHRITQAFTSSLESWIRRYPDQWLWAHRRWRTGPAAERNDAARYVPCSAASPGVFQ